MSGDPVNHPKHYNSHPSGVECITVAEHFGFNLGNALKYIWRAEEKGAPVQDLEKARWYLDREIERRARGHGVLDRLRVAEARIEEMLVDRQASVTVGAGLRVFGPWEAVKRVQTYLLLDSSHPIEREDVRRGLARDLQTAERRIAELVGELQAIQGDVANMRGSDWKPEQLDEILEAWSARLATALTQLPEAA